MNMREQQFYDWFIKTHGLGLTAQPCRFVLPRGMGTYTPDFFCSELSTYYEVVGTKSAYYHGRKKYEAMKVKYPDLVLLLVRPDGSEFVIPSRHQAYRRMPISFPPPKPIVFPSPKETQITYHENGKYIARFERDGNPYLIFKTCDFSHLVAFLALNQPEVL